jgi:predicted RNA-binding protein associated with RNAse of E/G family
VLPPIEEIKHNLDGTTERFDCHLVHQAPDYVVLGYVSDRPYTVAGAEVPAGSLTIGHYRPGSDYVLWEMYTPQAEPLGYYVHLCGEIKLGDRCVEWHDMTVDVWLGSDGRPEILDEDELERSVKAGRISPSEGGMIRQRARRLRTEGAGIVREFKRFDPAELLATLSPHLSQ